MLSTLTLHASAVDLPTGPGTSTLAEGRALVLLLALAKDPASGAPTYAGLRLHPPEEVDRVRLRGERLPDDQPGEGERRGRVAGIICGTLDVLDGVAIAQFSSVEEVAVTTTSRLAPCRAATEVGRNHISLGIRIPRLAVL